MEEVCWLRSTVAAGWACANRSRVWYQGAA
jgi:hypothetical protein